MNNKKSFDYFWEYDILPAIQKCEADVSDEFKSKTNFTKETLDVYKAKLSDIYNRKREWLKREYLVNSSNPVLDFHKLSAVMCRSIIGVKLFSFNLRKAEELFASIHSKNSMAREDKIRWQIDNVYVNYKLAFLVAQGIAFEDLRFWTTEKIKVAEKQESQELCIYKRLLETLNRNGKLSEYDVSNNHDNFIDSNIISLMKSDCLKRDFDYLQFASQMFQWQEYTKQQLLIQIYSENKHPPAKRVVFHMRA